MYRRFSGMTKALVSVTGLDTTGIIAGVAAKLSEMNINILDITQTILDGYFTMCSRRNESDDSHAADGYLRRDAQDLTEEKSNDRNR